MFSFFKQKEEKVKELVAFASGKTIPIDRVNDPVFSSRALGDGIAILPEEEIITAPCDGEIIAIMDESRHAVGIRLNNGAEILIHEGIETVNLRGKGFAGLVEKGQKVKSGDPIIQFSRQAVLDAGYEYICILVITNQNECPHVTYNYETDAVQKETVILKFAES